MAREWLARGWPGTEAMFASRDSRRHRPRPGPAARRLRHGRQRPLGACARAAPYRGTFSWRRSDVRHRRGRPRSRCEVAHDVRVLHGELAQATRRSSLPDEFQREDTVRAPRRPALEGGPDPFLRPAGLAGTQAPPSPHGRLGVDDGEQPAHDAHDLLQLWRAGGDRRRRPLARRRGHRPAQHRRAGHPLPAVLAGSCPIRTSSCEPRASTGSRTSCCGSSPTPSCVFTDVLWPDFRRENLFDAIREFQRRERRYGGVKR